MKKEVREKIEEAYLACEAHYGCKFERVPVFFCNRLRKKAGKVNGAKVGERTFLIDMTFSTKIMNLNGQDFLDEVPGHEVGHAVAIQLYNDPSHGEKWLEVMSIIGAKARTYHTLKT